MKRLKTRHRLLLGALALAGLIWAVDGLSGRGGPASLKAAETPAVPEAAIPEAGPNDAELIAQLTRVDYVPVAGELQQVERDLFIPTPLVAAAYAAKEVAPAVDAAMPASPAEAVPDDPDFSKQHRLVGVLIGATPMAVLDDRVMTLGAELDALRLVYIARDYVLFRHGQSGKIVRLELEAGSDKH